MTDARRTAEGLSLLQEFAIREARQSFWAFRQFLYPKMKLGWWQHEVCQELQMFHDDMVAGRRPKLLITAPPQHGKSRMVVEFLAWLAGKDPDLRVIYASYSERLGVRANVNLQRLYAMPRYQLVFPATKTGQTSFGTPDMAPALLTQSIIEYVGREGSFRNTTVRGAINGEGLDLGVIDDPFKGHEDAASKTIRDRTWNWFTDDFLTRFSENAGLLMILTRWHVDDLIGRMKSEAQIDLRSVSYPAIAERDELHRKEGDALFPEHKSLDFLLTRKEIMATSSWQALYQQNPQVIGGAIIKSHWFGRYKVLPRLHFRIMFADTAQKTGEHNDYSVFQVWGKGEDGKLYLIDQIRGKWEAPELKRRAIEFWNKHRSMDESKLGRLRALMVEDKASGTGLIQELRSPAGIPVHPIERVKDKYTRVLDAVGYIESGHVMLPEDAPFTSDFVVECEAFTADDSHLHDDQVDPLVDAIGEMLAKMSKAEILRRSLGF